MKDSEDSVQEHIEENNNDSNDSAEKLIWKMSFLLDRLKTLALQNLDNDRDGEIQDLSQFVSDHKEYARQWEEFSESLTILIQKCRSDKLKENICMYTYNARIEIRCMMELSKDYKDICNLRNFEKVVTECQNYLDTLKTKHLSEFR